MSLKLNEMTWDETREYMLNEIENRMRGNTSDEKLRTTMHSLRNGPNGQALLNAMVGIVRTNILQVRQLANVNLGPSQRIDLEDLVVSDANIPEDEVHLKNEAGKTVGKIVNLEPTCECGTSSLGYTQNGPGHSSWCPLASGRPE